MFRQARGRVLVSDRYTDFLGIAFTTAFICSCLILPLTVKAVEVDPELLESFKTNESSGYAIYFAAKANLSGIPQADWKQQNEFVNKALRENADRSQARVKSYLFNRRVPYRSLWKDNIIIVDKSDRDTFEGLLSFPEIEAIKGFTTGGKTP